MNDDVLPSEAIYGFAGWLTTRRQSVTLGAAHECGGVAYLFRAVPFVAGVVAAARGFL